MSVRWIGIVAGLLLGVSGAPVVAQSSADAFFHDAAQQYVNGDVEAARRSVTRGLEVAPSDPRLQALREKLTTQEQERGSSGSSQRGAQDRPQSQQSKGEGNQEEQSGESEEESRSHADTPSDQQSQSSRGGEAHSSAQAGDREGARDGNRRPTEALSQAQAARLLQALENQEIKLLREVRRQSQGQDTEAVAKDW
jgi:hypothetical protein